MIKSINKFIKVIKNNNNTTFKNRHILSSIKVVLYNFFSFLKNRIILTFFIYISDKKIIKFYVIFLKNILM